MAANLGQLVVSINMDSSDLTNGISQAQSKLSAFGDKCKAIGGALTAAITLPVVAVGAEIIKLASDAQEMQSKFSTVFGDSAEDAEAWAEAYGEAAGRSKNAIMTMMGDFGSVLTGLGMSRDAAAEFSGQVVELAMDLGSFNNMAPEEAFDKISSAMRGESEAAESLGVAMNEVTIAAQMQSMGLQGQFSDLDEVTKKQVLYNLIVSQSGDALGDAVKTSGSFANQMNALKGKLEDVGAALGTHLLPYATALVNSLKELTAGFGEITPEMQKTILVVAGIAAAIGPLLIIIGMLASAISSILGLFAEGGALAGIGVTLGGISAPVVAAVAAIVAAFAILGVAIYEVWQENEDLRNAVNAVWADIQDCIQRSIDAITALWSTFGPGITTVWSAVWETIKGVVSGALTVIVNIIGLLMNIATRDWEGAAENLKGIWSGLWEIIVTVTEGVVDILTAVFDLLVDAIKAIWEAFTDELSERWETFKTKVVTIAGELGEGIMSKFNTLESRVKTVWDAVKFAITNPVEAAKTVVLGIIDTIVNAFANMNIQIPPIKLPHVSVSTAYTDVGGVPIPVPDFSVNWYASGGIFSSPAIIGVGEAGSEAVIPLDKLGSLGNTININISGAGNPDAVARSVMRELSKRGVKV